MFGKPPPTNNGHAAPVRPPAADIAQIAGGGLVQLIVTNLTPLTFFLFLNDQNVAQDDVESLSLDIETPDASMGAPIIRATLARYVVTVAGARSLQRTELFPCTLEIVALGRRISVSASRMDSLECIWIDLGLDVEGAGHEVHGAKSLRFLLSAELLDARITWLDGSAEDLLPR